VERTGGEAKRGVDGGSHPRGGGGGPSQGGRWREAGHRDAPFPEDDLRRPVPARDNVSRHLLFQHRRRLWLSICMLLVPAVALVVDLRGSVLLALGLLLGIGVDAREAKIAEADEAVRRRRGHHRLRHQYVRRLEVAVNARVLVDVVQAGERLRHERARPRRVEWLARLDDAAEVGVHKVGHHEDVVEALHARRRDQRQQRDDVGMAEVSQEANLTEHLREWARGRVEGGGRADGE
jgi:hypothetical protein